MADIPTYVSTQSARTGPVGPYSDPNQQGAQIGEALQGLGSSTERASRQMALAINRTNQDKLTKQHYDDARWAGQSYEQEKRVISEFMANPENNQKESFAKDLTDFSKERMAQYTGDTAPSPRALDIFRQNMDSLNTNMYDRALGVGYRNSINNGISSINTQVTDAMASYRNSRALGDKYASSDIIDSVAHISANINSTFSKIAPDVADKMHEDLISQSVLSSMVHDPETARQILGWSKVSEQTRTRLGKEIDQAADTRNIVERESFNNGRSDLLVATENGKNRDKIPLERYAQYYPDDQAAVQKSRDDAYIDSMVKASDVVSGVSSYEASHQLKALSDFQKGVSSTGDKVAYQKIYQQIGENVKLQQNNPVGWLQRYNPTVSNLLKRAADAPATEQAGAINTLNDAVLKYQGQAPADASPEEKKQYLDRPLNDRHLLGTDESTQMAADLNVATPKEFIKKMGETLQRYPNNQHQMIAFNDLVTMPGRGGLKQEYQLAWQNKDAWWLDTYLGALSGGKSIDVPETDRKNLEQHIDSNPTWLQFKSAMIGDDFQRAKEIDGFRQGINQYARALSTQGKGIKQSASDAVNMLISETLGITKINGRPMVVDRSQGPGQPKMTDADVSNLGRRLGLALQFVDPREVDQKAFSSLQMFGKDETKIPRLQVLRDSITSRGFFQTGQDGKSASLYYSDDNGSVFQVRDRGGKPFNINFKDLPAFETKSISMLGMKDISGAESSGGQPMKHYDIIKSSGSIFDSSTTTNWPAHMDWLHAPTK